jgi:coenzyme Q-binding protein COQ10
VRYALKKTLPYRPEQLFDLVAGVEQYPRFVPWVSDLRVLRTWPGEDGAELLDARAEVRFAIVRESFTTRVRRDPAALEVRADLLSGPFRRLHTVWRFRPEGAGTEVSFEIDFEFGSRLLQGLLAANFERAVRRLVGCFETRAAALYG